MMMMMTIEKQGIMSLNKYGSSSYAFAHLRSFFLEEVEDLVFRLFVCYIVLIDTVEELNCISSNFLVFHTSVEGGYFVKALTFSVFIY